MEGQVKVIEHYLCIEMPREVDHHHAAKIREVADRMLLREEVEHIVFDFGKTIFMDSSGIGVMMGRLKKIKGLGGKVYVIHANHRMEKMLQLSGILPYVEIMK